MNAAPRDRHPCALRGATAQPLVPAGLEYFHRGMVLCSFVCDSASLGPDLFPGSLLEDDLDEGKNLHTGPLRVGNDSLVPAQSAPKKQNVLQSQARQGVAALEFFVGHLGESRVCLPIIFVASGPGIPNP